MSARNVAALALLVWSFAATTPPDLTAQRGGKIDEVERQARSRGTRDGAADKGIDVADCVDDECDDGLLFAVVGNIFRALLGRWGPGQGYLSYPYAEPRVLETFVLREVTRDRSFGAVSASYYQDDGSTLRAGHVSLEGAKGPLHGTLEYSYYREPTPIETDHLHLWRLGVGVAHPLGWAGYFRTGLALRGMTLDDGSSAFGPEVELGMQLFPSRPLGLSGTARLAGLTWEGGRPFDTLFRDATAAGSVFIGRMEVQAGYRWTRIGRAPLFAGPTLGTRIWF